MLNIQHFMCNPFQENCWLVWNENGKGMLVDPGFYDEAELGALRSFIGDHGITLEAIFLTHGHFDHIFGVKACQDLYGAPVYMEPADKQMLVLSAEMSTRFGLNAPATGFTTTDIHDGDCIEAAGSGWTVIGTPGHTPGGVCYHCPEEGIVFTGDTLFAGSIGRSDLPMGEYDDLIRSIMDKVMGLDGSTEILCGHGPYSTITKERTNNPFLVPFNEPVQDEIDWDADGIELHG